MAVRNKKARRAQGFRPAKAFLFFLFLFLLAGGAWWLFRPVVPDSPVTPSAGTNVSLPADRPVANATEEAPPIEGPPEEAAPQDSGVHSGTVSAGDTAGGILQDWLNPGEVNEVVDMCKNVYPLARIREGQPYMVMEDEGGFSRFEYEIDRDQKLVICRVEDKSFTAALEKIDYQVVLELVEGRIDSNLFQSMADVGEAPTLAISLAEIFAWEINFIRDLREGDSYVILVEKRFREGEFRGYGKLLAARFVNQGTIYEAFRFTPPGGIPEYYTSTGESVKRAFLKAPLAFNRISSGFSASRLHPILQEWKAHPAVDYAAPTGTPVKAVGNGQVTFAGWGKGAGNYIAIKHPNNYETMYLHLSGFARGLKAGNRVRQGEVIGFVGSTGYATGPHLDFRMKKDGRFINPIQALSPRSEPVEKKDLPVFNRRIEELRAYMNGRKSLLEHQPES